MRDAGQTGTSSMKGTMQFWKRMKQRWRMTWVDLAIGTFSASLWTVPAAYFALRTGHAEYGIFNAAASALAGIAAVMHWPGIRQERAQGRTDPEDLRK